MPATAQVRRDASGHFVPGPSGLPFRCGVCGCRRFRRKRRGVVIDRLGNVVRKSRRVCARCVPKAPPKRCEACRAAHRRRCALCILATEARADAGLAVCEAVWAATG